MTCSRCSRRSSTASSANGGLIFNHDMVVKQIGGRPVMLVDYWDAGYVQLDVTDPANPTLITDTDFAERGPAVAGLRADAGGQRPPG